MQEQLSAVADEARALRVLLFHLHEEWPMGATRRLRRAMVKESIAAVSSTIRLLEELLEEDE